MSVFTKLANAIFSPVDDTGNQRSVANGDAQMWGTELERLIMALVAEASDLELPNLLIRYTITGGTANAIEATANLPIPSAPGEALYAIQIAQDNTGPVTINGKRWLTNVGNEFVAGGIKAGGIYLFLDNGTHYRAITDQDVSALVAQAEADAERAEAAEGRAQDYANDAASAAGLGVFYDTEAVEADTSMSYSGGSAVAAGYLVTTRLDGKIFAVAASAATDHHLTTAGGVKLYDRGVYSSPAIAQTQQVMDRVRRGLPVDIIVVSDSTGEGVTRWPQQLGIALGQKFAGPSINIRHWNTGTDNYDAAVNLYAGSSPAVTIWNYAISGSFATRPLGEDFIAALTPGTLGGRDPDLVMVNYGHNGGDAVGVQLPLEAACTATIGRYLPFTPIIVIGQNKSLVNDAMRDKVRAFNHLATATGCGFINVHSFFEDYAQPSASYYSDDVHPNDLGSKLWAYCVSRAFEYQPDATRSIGRSPLTRGPIFAMEEYDRLATATRAGVTVSKDTTSGFWQTRGGSMKVTADGASAYAFLSWDVIASTDIVPYRGRMVTATAIIRRPAAANTAQGRISLYDGITAVTAPPPLELGNGFVAVSVSMKVGLAATMLRLDIYSAQAGANSDSYWVDRVNVVDGPLPADPAILANDIGSLIVGGNGVAILHPNGSMECRKIVPASSVAVGTAWGALFQSGDIALGNWQQNFNAIDIQNVRAVSDDGALTPQPLQFGGLLTTGPRSIRLWSPTSVGAKNYTIAVEGKGRWK